MKINHYTGGVLLVAGTCIGAGMLALPLTMASSGFWLANGLLVSCWLATYYCGLLVLEVNLTLPIGANFISMAKKTLGRSGEGVAWVTYLLLLYSLLAAYLSVGGDIFMDGIKALSTASFKDWIGPLPWILITSGVIYAGASFVDLLNRFLVIGLVIAYILLIGISVPHTSTTLLSYHEWGHILPALPILVTAFGYHVIIPVLRGYLEGDVKKLTKMIFWGSAIPLGVYILWDLVVYGTISIGGPEGLTAIAATSHPTIALTNAMASITHSHALVSVIESFIFFAIATSFVGISFSLYDFIRDGIVTHHGHVGRVGALVGTFLPPLLFALFFPKGFMLALTYAGIFVAILHGILPALMVVAARRKNMVKEYQAPGGLVGVFLILAASILVIVSQVMY